MSVILYISISKEFVIDVFIINNSSALHKVYECYWQLLGLLKY